MSDQDAKWAERVRRREALHAEMERQREACRQEHIAVVRDAFGRNGWVTGNYWAAEAAVDALIAHGVCLGVRIGGGEGTAAERTERADG